MQQTSALAVRLRPEAWRAWMDRLKLARVADQAVHVGVSRAHLYKVIGGGQPGEQFIAACMGAYDGKFEDLFEITETS